MYQANYTIQTTHWTGYARSMDPADYQTSLHPEMTFAEQAKFCAKLFLRTRQRVHKEIIKMSHKIITNGVKKHTIHAMRNLIQQNGYVCRPKWAMTRVMKKNGEVLPTKKKQECVRQWRNLLSGAS